MSVSMMSVSTMSDSALSVSAVSVSAAYPRDLNAHGARVWFAAAPGEE